MLKTKSNLKNNRLQFLLKLLVDDKINAQELEELAELMAQPGNEELMNSQLSNTWDNASTATELSNDVYRKITDNPRFRTSLNQNDIQSPIQGSTRKLWYYAAAVVLLCCSIGLGMYFYKNSSPNSHILGNTEYAQLSSKSNRDYVTLTLSNGKELVLDEAAIGKISREDNITITKNKEGQLIYDLSKVADGGELAYNIISTPIGNNYQVILSDGTKVWLNAKSSLKFPAVFRGSERRVELSGEAYFEVAHNKKQPFLLSAKDMTVQVLGTHFNVTAYDDDDIVKASLLEGSINAKFKTSSLLLKPGQQAVLRNGAAVMNAKQFDVDEIMDWKNGYFIFRDEPIDEIMKEISRWYNIEVNYQGNLRKEAFGGKYLKSSSLEELLSSLELTGTVKFKIEGRRVTVVQ